MAAVTLAASCTAAFVGCNAVSLGASTPARPFQRQRLSPVTRIQTDLNRSFLLAPKSGKFSMSVNSKVDVDAALNSSSDAGPNQKIVPDTEISITKTSFGTIGLTVGVALLSFGFGAYFNLLPGSSVSALMLTYGFPLTLIGFALKYAELKPVPCVSYEDAVALRDLQATPIQLQVRSDVTRYRYGDEQHLDEALKRIFRYGQAGGIQRRFAPVLDSVAEEVYEGNYSLSLQFHSETLPLSEFTSRESKFTSFFGPGISTVIEQVGEKTFRVRLVSNGPAGPAA